MAAGSRMGGRLAAALVAAVALVIGMALPVFADSSYGYDVSYPQCGQALPIDPAFVIVGVDGGRVRSPNPCLGIELGGSQLGWGYTVDGRPAFYVNTANPGPLVSEYWPSGQVWPQLCADDYPANDSTGCAYDYGWNAARDAFDRATAAAIQAFGDAAPDIAASDWWLDVETGNTWQALDEGPSPTALANDAAALRGMRDHLLSRGAPGVGVYSADAQWAAIVGTEYFPSVPVWYAGAGSEQDARDRCAAWSFTGGPVTLAQFRDGEFDANLRCES